MTNVEHRAGGGRALVVGWYSFPAMGATAGDMLARDVVCEWLNEARIPYDVAVAVPFVDGVSLEDVDPHNYSRLVFVCGPFGNGPPITGLLSAFAHCELIGVDVSMLDPIEEWNPFSLLLERDSSRTVAPDLAFARKSESVPVVGVLKVHHQNEYGRRARHDDANRAIDRMLERTRVARVPIETRLDTNDAGHHSAGQVESLIARMDAVVTTRLHGCVLALKHGVPPIAIDPIAGGAKVRRQCEAIGWELIFTVDELDDDLLLAAMHKALDLQTRERARACADDAIRRLQPVRTAFLSWFTPDPAPIRPESVSSTDHPAEP